MDQLVANTDESGTDDVAERDAALGVRLVTLLRLQHQQYVLLLQVVLLW